MKHIRYKSIEQNMIETCAANFLTQTENKSFIVSLSKYIFNK